MWSKTNVKIYKFLLQNETFVFLGLILLCFSLRIQNFSSASIWADESFTLDLANRTVSQNIDISCKDVNPPLYGLVMHYWGLLLGYGLPIMRFFSVLCSVATALVLYKTGKRFFNYLTAIGAVLFFSFSNMQIYFSEEARCYAFLCFLIAISLYCFLGFIRYQKGKWLFGLFTINLLILYTHYIAGFLFIAQGLIAFILFVRKPKQLFGYIISQLLAVGLFFPWFNISFIKAGQGSGSTWLPELTGEIFNRFVIGVFNNKLAVNAFSALVIVGLGLGIYFFIKARPKFKSFLILFCLSALPLSLICFITLHYVRLFHERYELFCTVPMFLFFGYIISSIRWNILIKVVSLLLVLAFMMPELKICIGNRNEDWVKACSVGEAFLDDQTSVLISPGYVRVCYDYYNMQWPYYHDYANLEFYENTYNVFPVYDTIMVNAIKDRLKKRVTYYSSHYWSNDKKIIENYLLRTYHMIFSREYMGIRLYVYEKN